MKRLEPWNVLFYCADHYEVYNSLISPHRLFQGKARTHGIERNNGHQRHWFLRFKRKSIAPSRSLEMVELSMALFAAYHVNKTFSLPCILKLKLSKLKLVLAKMYPLNNAPLIL